MTSHAYVAYYRVSTQRQGQSGLGLAAQRKSVTDYLNGHASSLIAEFTEIESGKRKDRPELTAALALAKKHKATLVIAKLDRLARNVHFISGLLESKVKFVAVDMPEADRSFLQMAAVFAEWEGRRISERTKAALAATKAKGTQLGKCGIRMAPIYRKRADVYARSITSQVRLLQDEHPTIRGLTAAMNAAGIPARSGGRWHPTSVARLLKRMG